MNAVPRHLFIESIFEDLKGNSFDFPTDIDFEDENYLKTFAENQVPDIYDTQKRLENFSLLMELKNQ